MMFCSSSSGLLCGILVITRWFLVRTKHDDSFRIVLGFVLFLYSQSSVMDDEFIIKYILKYNCSDDSCSNLDSQEISLLVNASNV